MKLSRGGSTVGERNGSEWFGSIGEKKWGRGMGLMVVGGVWSVGW